MGITHINLYMKKMLIFNTALAPYMIDQYNDLNQLYEVEVVFLFTNVSYDKFNQDKLLALLNCKYSFLLKGPVYKERVFRFGILKTIREFKPDIIIGYEYSFTTQYLLLLKRLGVIRQKIGSTIDDSLDICNHVQSRIRLFARKYAVRRLDFIIVLSKEVSQFYQDKFKLKEDNIIISPILQSPERLRENGDKIEIIANEYRLKYQLKGKKVLLYVGRFVAVKGLTGFINNIDQTLKEHNDIVLVLVGDGEERNNIETILKNKRLFDKIILPGRFEGIELYAWYLCASGFVLPSIYEPYGAVVNESLIFGTKVFCSKYAGSSNLIHSENGIIFDPLDEKNIIDKFKIFLNLIETVHKIDLTNKKSLMSNKKLDFIIEWEKLSK
jgi:glycosyltransferase involved in cell wall biosynthesis